MDSSRTYVQEVLSLGFPLTDGTHTGGDQSWTPGRLVETQRLAFEDLCHKENGEVNLR